MHTVYLDDNNFISIACPRCRKTRDIDATPLLKKKGDVKLTFRFKCRFCDCGHKDCAECETENCANGNTNVVVVERRKFFRKVVHLPGLLRSESGKRHSIRVLDLSRTGLRTKVLSPHAFRVDQRLVVEFNLDDARGTPVKKTILVRKVNEKVVDGEFIETDVYDQNDKAIGFYLMR